MKKSTFIKLGVVAALVMLPRRSSKKSGCGDSCGCAKPQKADVKPNKDSKNKSDNRKNCLCPLCRMGKCPLHAIGKCICCKKTADKADKNVNKSEK